MLDISEAIKEKDEEEALIEAEGNVEIVHRLANNKPKPERALTRNPSFFKRMLSSKKMSKIISAVEHNESDDGSQQDSLEQKDPDENGDDHNEVDHEYIDPPMPNIGAPVNIDLLISRNAKAEFGMEKLMEMITRDTTEAFAAAKAIPVSEHHDRVSVTQEISDRMAKVRTAKEINKRVQDNMNQIQKALNIRKSAVVIMNSNYSKRLVRTIEPIYVGEARTVVRQLDNEAEKLMHKATKKPASTSAATGTASAGTGTPAKATAATATKPAAKSGSTAEAVGAITPTTRP